MFNIKSKALSFIAEKAITMYAKKNLDCDLTIDNFDVNIEDGKVEVGLKFNMTEEDLKKVIEKVMAV